MKIVFSVSLLLIYVLSQQSNAETYIAKIICNHKKELFCKAKVDNLSFNESTIKRDNNSVSEIFRFVNKSLNKTEEELPLNQAFDFVMQYRKGGALINIGTPNPKLFKNNSEKNYEITSQNTSLRGRGNGRGLIVKVLSISF